MRTLTWDELLPTIAKMDVVTGTPVRFVKGDEVAGFPLRHDMSLTVRPWGEENDKYCMVIDDKGTSVPCPMESLVIDLDHPLGFAAAMQWTYRDLWKEGHWEEIFKDEREIQMIDRGDASEKSKRHLASLIGELVDYETGLQGAEE